ERDRVIPHRPGPAPIQIQADRAIGRQRPDVVVRRLIDVETFGGASPAISTEVQPTRAEWHISRSRQLQEIQIFEVTDREIGGGIGVEQRLGKRSSSLRARMGPKSLKRDAPNRVALPQIHESVVVLRTRRLAPAIIILVASSHVVVRASLAPSGERPLPRPVAVGPPTRLELALQGTGTASRDQIDGAPE